MLYFLSRVVDLPAMYLPLARIPFHKSSLSLLLVHGRWRLIGEVGLYSTAQCMTWRYRWVLQLYITVKDNLNTVMTKKTVIWQVRDQKTEYPVTKYSGNKILGSRQGGHLKKTSDRKFWVCDYPPILGLKTICCRMCFETMFNNIISVIWNTH